MSKQLNISINTSKIEVKILSKATALVGKLLEIRDLIEDTELLTEDAKQSFREMLTESIMEFIDFDYLDRIKENGNS